MKSTKQKINQEKESKKLEKIFVNLTSAKGLVSRICKGLSQFSHTKTSQVLNRCFSHIKMANKDMQTCPTAFAIKKVQGRTTLDTTSRLLRCHHKNFLSRKITRAGLAVEIGALIYCYWEQGMAQPLCNTIWQLLKNLNIKLSCDPGIPALGMYPRELKTYVHTQMWV